MKTGMVLCAFCRYLKRFGS